MIGQYGAFEFALAPRYRLEDELGRGAMGVVYRARDVRLGRQVAIKMLHPSLTNELGVRRFQAEIQIAARLHHVNIVGIHESGEAAERLFYVMDYLGGETLRARIAREKQLSVDDALRIVGELAEGLQYAHENGVVHRDVKPENILLAAGRACLMDFGLARALNDVGADRLTATGISVGTPAYLSPEQAAAESDVGPAADQYALACVLFEMLAGEPPFTGPTAAAIAMRHVAHEPPPISSRRRTATPAIEVALLRAMEKVPADRYATVRQFASALRAEAPSAIAPSSAQWRATRPMYVVSALVAAAAIGLTSYVSFHHGPLNDRRVVVFPLSDAATNGRDATAGWDVSIAIGASLERADPLRVIDGYSHLGSEARGDMRLFTDATARRISVERGARHYIDGVITHTADSVTVVLRLHDTAGDSLIAQTSASGPAGSALPTLGLRAVALLLPRMIDPARQPDGEDLAARSPAAVALWAQGEREYRQTHFAGALALFRRAIEQDSALAIAAIRGAQAASWESHLEEAEALARLAVAGQRNLSRRHALFAAGLLHYLTGNADSSEALLQRSLALDDASPEPAMALGEVHQHLLGAAAAPPDSAAEFWMREALRRDSMFTPPLVHLAEFVLRRGDATLGDGYIERMRRHATAADLLRPLQLMSACVRGDHTLWDAATEADAASVLSASAELMAHFAQPRCAEGGLRAILRSPVTTPGVRWDALLRLQGLLVATRRNVELRAMLDSTVRAGTSQARSLYIIDALAGADRSLMRPRAREAIAFAQQAYGPAYERASAQTRWVLGLWHALEGDTARLARISAVSDSVARSGSRREQLFASALRGHVLVMRGDTVGAIAALRQLAPSARRDSLTYELFEPLAVERSVLSVLQFARGSYDDAMKTSATLEHSQPAIYLAFLPLSLDVRQRSMMALDKRAQARQFGLRLDAIAAVPHGDQ